MAVAAFSTSCEEIDSDVWLTEVFFSSFPGVWLPGSIAIALESESRLMSIRMLNLTNCAWKMNSDQRKWCTGSAKYGGNQRSTYIQTARAPTDSVTPDRHSNNVW
jgi:hypothetical protein